MKKRPDFGKIAPKGYEAMRGLKAYVDGCGIDPILRGLVECRVSQINGCVFCLDMHAKEARAAGEKQQRLDCLSAWHEAPFYTARERAALLWAEAVTLVSDTGVPDEVYDEAREEFSEKELVDLTFMIVLMNGWNRLAVSFRKVPQAG